MQLLLHFKGLVWYRISQVREADKRGTQRCCGKHFWHSGKNTRTHTAVRHLPWQEHKNTHCREALTVLLTANPCSQQTSYGRRENTAELYTECAAGVTNTAQSYCQRRGASNVKVPLTVFRQTFLSTCNVFRT
jgi:hypothetical protein